MIIVITQLPE